MKHTFLILLASALAVSVSTHASEGLVRVVIGKSSAPANTALGVGSRLTTSAKSQSEVALDNGVVRAGSNTSLRIAGKDDIALEKGLALVAAQPRFFRRSVSVGTPEHRMKVRGTAQIFHEPGRSLRVVVIEGKMTVSLNSMTRESVTLGAGQVLVIRPSESELPEPVEIDLNRLISTATLIHDRADSLPTVELVQQAGRRQALELDRGNSGGNGGGGVSDGGDGVGGPDINARPEELVHEAIVDDIGDLDGDGDLDADDFDGDDFDADDDDPSDADDNDPAGDDRDDNDAGGGDDGGDGGGGGGGGDEG